MSNLNAEIDDKLLVTWAGIFALPTRVGINLNMQPRYFLA
ncbi:hypothetical protein NSP_18500 [Nodularia spumigena CCY9414]|nr:hypothetical protein NSP_18500 [Nodularia spumigena CCY9414]